MADPLIIENAFGSSQASQQPSEVKGKVSNLKPLRALKPSYLVLPKARLRLKGKNC